MSFCWLRQNACRGFGADFNAVHETLDAAPAFGHVEKRIEAASFTGFNRSIEARLCVGRQAHNMPANRRYRGDAEDEVQPLGPALVVNLQRAIMTIAGENGSRPGWGERGCNPAPSVRIDSTISVDKREDFP